MIKVYPNYCTECGNAGTVVYQENTDAQYYCEKCHKATLWAANLDTPPPAPTEGVKLDEGKTRYDLEPPLAMAAINRVFTKGAIKYSDDGWREVRPLNRRYYSAIRRHVSAWLIGEDLDQEIQEHHLACAAANMIILLDHALGGVVSSRFQDENSKGVENDQVK